MITEQQLKILIEQSPLTLVEWWDVLNRWGWVDALGPPDPIPDPWHPNTLRGAVMRWIEGLVGDEYILRICNVVITKRMTEKAFNEWWCGRDRKYTDTPVADKRKEGP